METVADLLRWRFLVFVHNMLLTSNESFAFNRGFTYEKKYFKVGHSGVKIK